MLEHKLDITTGEKLMGTFSFSSFKRAIYLMREMVVGNIYIHNFKLSCDSWKLGGKSLKLYPVGSLTCTSKQPTRGRIRRIAMAL